MKRYFIVLILGFLVSGCSSTWHIKKAIEKDPDSFKTDTTINEIVFKLDTVIKIDTNILILLPRDTVKIEKLIPKYISFDPVVKKKGIITVKVSAYKGNLKIVSYLDSAFIYRYQDSIRVKDALITKLRTINTNQTITITEQEKELKWYEKVLNIGKYVLEGLLTFVLVIIIIKLIRWLKKK